MNRECKHCGSEFDTASAHKAEFGGNPNHKGHKV